MKQLKKTWLRSFLGREREFSELKSQFLEFQKTQSPSCTLLLGESGVGKTRLIHEFYSWLVKTQQGKAKIYWPDKLSIIGDNLAINPFFDQQEKDWSILPPFIWWGLRFSKQIQRNRAGDCALDSYLPALIPHFFPLELKKRKEKTKKKLTYSSLDIGANIILNFATLGITGLLKSAVDTGLQISEVVKYVEETKRMEHLAGRGGVSQRLSNRIDSVIHDLEMYFKSVEDSFWVLVLDDLQWVNDDEDSFVFLEKFFQVIADKNLPVFVIATCWPLEWKEDEKNSAKKDDLSFSELLKRNFSGNSGKSGQLNSIDISEKIDLSPMLKKALPGLTGKQVSLILDKADGNPQLLDEIISYFRESGHLFVGRKISSRLVDDTAITESSHGLELFLRKRYSLLPERHKELTSLITLFRSISFSTAFLPLLYRKLGRKTKINSVLKESFDKYSILYKERSGLDEFRHRTYFDLSSDYFIYGWDIYGKDEIENHFFQTLEEFCRSDSFSTLSNQEKKWLLVQAVQYRKDHLDNDSSLGVFAGNKQKLISLLIEDKNERSLKIECGDMLQFITDTPHGRLPDGFLIEFASTVSMAESDVNQHEFWKKAFLTVQASDKSKEPLDLAAKFYALSNIAIRMKLYSQAVETANTCWDLVVPLYHEDWELDHLLYYRIQQIRSLLFNDQRSEADEILRWITLRNLRLRERIENQEAICGKKKNKMLWTHENIDFTVGCFKEEQSYQVSLYDIFTNDAQSISFFTPFGHIQGIYYGPFSYEVSGEDLIIFLGEKARFSFTGVEADCLEQINNLSAITVFTFEIPSSCWPVLDSTRDIQKEVKRYGSPVAATPVYNRYYEGDPVCWAELIGAEV